MSKPARRNCLVGVSSKDTTHPGLWLDRFMGQYDKEGEGRRQLVEEVVGIPEPRWYLSWFKGWQDSLKQYGACTEVAEVATSMAVGLGADSVLETSVTIHHTLGVPYIPGSALKGLASSFADKHMSAEWGKDIPGGAHFIMFGNTESAGHVQFFDALPVPTSFRLVQDIMTVHHGPYYKGDNPAPPADWNGPNPVSFICANGKFLVAISGPEKWAQAALTILAHAFELEGIGAKTSSGYGRLHMPKEKPPSADEKQADSLIEYVNALTEQKAAGSIHGYYEQWKLLEEPSARMRLAQAILGKIKEVGRVKKDKNKAWYKELLKALE